MRIMCIRCKIRKCKVLSSSRECQTFGTQMAVKNLRWFVGEVFHTTYNHHVELKNVRFKI